MLSHLKYCSNSKHCIQYILELREGWSSVETYPLQIFIELLLFIHIYSEYKKWYFLVEKLESRNIQEPRTSTTCDATTSGAQHCAFSVLICTLHTSHPQTRCSPSLQLQLPHLQISQTANQIFFKCVVFLSFSNSGIITIYITFIAY